MSADSTIEKLLNKFSVINQGAPEPPYMLGKAQYGRALDNKSEAVNRVVRGSRD